MSSSVFAGNIFPKVVKSHYGIGSFNKLRSTRYRANKIVPELNARLQDFSSFSYGRKVNFVKHSLQNNLGKLNTKRNVLFGDYMLLESTRFTTQNHNFSLRGSFDSILVTHTAVFKSISESAVVEKAQNFIIQVHDASGLPWWMSIILSTCLVRFTLILPLALYQNFTIARLENIRTEMNDTISNLRHSVNHEVRNRRWSEKQAKAHLNKEVRMEWTRLIERDNCHPAKAAILALVQIPLWVVFSTAFRNLVYKLPYNDAFAEMKWLELSVGGAAWFSNLTIPDSLVLPVVLGITNLTIVEVQTMIHKGQRSRIQKYATNFFRCFSLFMIPVSASVPACLTLYWTTSSLFGLCQNLIILSPRVRKLFRIPPSPSSHTHPYSHLADQIRSRFKK